MTLLLLQTWLCTVLLLISPSALRQAQARRVYVLLMFYFFYIFLLISVRPVISTSTAPIFTEFAGLIEL